MNLEVKLFGKEILRIRTGDPENLAPDFTSTHIGFTANVEKTKEIDTPDRSDW